jgi:hypothetical protein
MTVTASPDAFDAYNRHIDELAELVDTQEAGLQASATACVKMRKSIVGLRWSLMGVFGLNLVLFLGVALGSVR